MDTLLGRHGTSAELPVLPGSTDPSHEARVARHVHRISAAAIVR